MFNPITKPPAEMTDHELDIRYWGTKAKLDAIKSLGRELWFAESFMKAALLADYNSLTEEVGRRGPGRFSVTAE